MVNFTRTLEIAGTSGFVQPIKLVQYDDTLPVGVFELVENGQPFDIPAGTKAKVRLRKADGKGVYNDATVSGDTVQVVFTQQMTAAFGVGFLNIELIYDGGVKSSEPVQVVVLENAVQQGAIESSDEFLTLDEIVKQVETLRQQTATDAASAAASKTAAASSATAAQSARAGAEAAESRVNAIVAGNEAYTKQESRNLFARALKAETDKAASLEIYPDEGSNVAVTSYGFTEQAGTGDPSPTNVRQIMVGGKRLVEVVLDGTESWNQNSSPANTGYLYLRITAAANSSHYAISNILGFKYQYGGNGVFAAGNYLYFGAALGKQYTLDTWKAYLAARYAAGDPVIVWYQPADESQATGIYTPIESTGAEYSCVCVPLTDYLCDGDTVETCVKSGFDKKVAIGSEESIAKLSKGSAVGSEYWGLQYGDSEILGYQDGYIAYSDWVERSVAYGGEYTHFYNARGFIHIVLKAKTSDEALSLLKNKPLSVWYRSTAYTPENDIPVCLETHKNTYKEYLVADMNNTSENYPGWQDTSVFRILGSGVNNAVPGSMSNIAPKGIIRASTLGSGVVFFTKDQLGGLTQTEFKAAYPDLVVQVTLPYKTPITYAHDPVYLDAYPDGNGKFTVSGEKLVSAVYNKSLSKAFEELQSAVLAMGAKLSS